LILHSKQVERCEGDPQDNQWEKSDAEIIPIGNRDLKSSRRERPIFPLRVTRRTNTVSVVIGSRDAAQQKGKQRIWDKDYRYIEKVQESVK
jgi:hypothetical protein